MVSLMSPVVGVHMHSVLSDVSLFIHLDFVAFGAGHSGGTEEE